MPHFMVLGIVSARRQSVTDWLNFVTRNRLNPSTIHRCVTVKLWLLEES
jgi:hypothetical protein